MDKKLKVILGFIVRIRLGLHEILERKRKKRPSRDFSTTQILIPFKDPHVFSPPHPIAAVYTHSMTFTKVPNES